MPDPLTAAVTVRWGMKAAGWVASPIISELYKKGSSYLCFDASEKLKQLEAKILLLQRVMEAVEENPRLEQLFKDLKSAFYEAEDILDDVEYHRLERQIQDGKLKSEVAGAPPKKDRMKNIWSAMKKSSPLKDQESGMSKIKLKQSLDKIEKVINDACEILERMNLQSVGDANRCQAVAANSRGAVVTTATPPSVVIGRDKDCDKIVAMLHEGEEDGQSHTNNAQCYSVIGIHGIGGSGKSTLAQLVCSREKKDRQEKKDGHFDLVMWVHVSQQFRVDTIFKEMFEAATGNPCSEFNNLDTLQHNLEKELHGKRFLLVLDDVWYNIKDVMQYEKLQLMLSPLNAGEEGSKILVTSRTEDALLALGAAKNRCIPISVLDEDVFLTLFMHYAIHGLPIDNHVRRRLEGIGTDIAKKLKGSPLAAKIVGGQLRIRQNIDFWRRVRDRDLFNETMGALWWSYQHLDEEVRRCFAYCSIFPNKYGLERDELVKLWAAEGFVRCTNNGEEMEDVCRDYFDELVSASFLQLKAKEDPDDDDYYLVHDLLHDLAEKVAGSDCWRIENHLKQSGLDFHHMLSGLTDKVAGSNCLGIENHLKQTGKDLTKEDCAENIPPDVRHVFIQTYDSALITEKICKLDNLRTLIIDNAEWTTKIEEEVLKSIFERLKKLRVLTVTRRGFGKEILCINGRVFTEYVFLRAHNGQFSLPTSIHQLRHLRYLALRSALPAEIRLVLPDNLTKLYHMQILDFDYIKEFVFSSDEDLCNLVYLRHLIGYGVVGISSIGRLTSLQTMRRFEARKEQGYELKQLGNLNKLCGTLSITRLENVESKAEALEAKLAEKEGLKELELCWYDEASPEVQAEVLEGLCPPTNLESLTIHKYKGLRYPSWMVGKHSGGPKYLKHLKFERCVAEPGPELGGFCTHLRTLSILQCSWDTLPDCMEHLTLLHELWICQSKNIRSLPTLPQSLQDFTLACCNEELMSACTIIGGPSWQKIQHIPKAYIGGYYFKMGLRYDGYSDL